MSKLPKISLSKISFYSICLVAITMPLTFEINSIAIILAAIVNFLYVTKKQNLKLLLPNKKDMLFIVYYLIIVISLLYTENIGMGLKNLEYNLSFIIIPVFFYRLKTLNKSEYKILIKSFILSLVLVSVFFLIIACIKYVNKGDSSVFFYHSLGSPFEFNAIYFSLYICLALIFILFEIRRENFKKLIPIFIFLILMLLLLSSKSIIIFIFILFGYIFIIRRKVDLRRMFYLAIIFSSLIVLILGSGFLKERFKKITNFDNLIILKEDSMTDFSKVNGLTLRLMFVKYSVLESLNNPLTFLIGQGFGDKQIFLDSVYERHNMAKIIHGRKVGYYGYNTHNQYIDMFISIGFFGLCYLIFMFLKLINFVKMDNIAISFYMLLLWAFLFESILSVNKGIVFFVFWSIFFINNKFIDTNENSNIRY
ncbi:O-antigen ligase family protein [Yeosuana marina]|uniref:O-antigen ligase family protein n=1 Tax=Yeosuana marina TaxID=1565536 RepID=UPI0030C7F60F